MSNIVGIGANVCDLLFKINDFPKEDTKIKSSQLFQCGGGPCATGLAAASKLGETTAYIGNLADDTEGVFLKNDLEKYGISTEFVRIKSGYSSFVSCVLLAEKNESRTCIFNRGNVPELILDEQQKQAISNAKILMVDGNDIKAAIDGAKIARDSKTKVLYDAGGLYDGVDKLLPYADILIPSEEFALGFTGKTDVKEALVELYNTFLPEVVVITQGKKGGMLYDGTEMRTYPAFCVNAVDTNGSGDVFHGAFAFALTKGYDYYKACVFSSAVSAIKCTRVGAREAVPGFEETERFLKECGVNEL